MKVNIDSSELNVKIGTEKINPVLENLEINPSTEQQEYNHPNSDGYNEVIVNAIKGESIDINPSVDSQYFTGLYDAINVNAVTSNIDSNISSNNIRSGVSILGVDGNVIELEGETKEVTPSTNTQNITPSEGKNGLTEVIVNPIPSEYIIPEGTTDINEGGVYDVTRFAFANVTAAGGDPVYTLSGTTIDVLGMKKGVYVLDMIGRSNANINLYYSPNRETNSNYSLSLSTGALYIFTDITDNLPVNTTIGTYVQAITGGEVYIYTLKIRNGGAGIDADGKKVINFVDNSAQTISGLKTFAKIPRQVDSTAPTNDTEFANKKYVDDSINLAITSALGGSY